MVCVHSQVARDYTKYLETQDCVKSYEAGVPLSEEQYVHIYHAGIRTAYFRTLWTSDFLIYFTDGRKEIHELSSAEELKKRSSVEKLEFSRRYWSSTDISGWKVVLLEEGAL